MNSQNILNFFFELGHLRRIHHEGWKLVGVDNPESVAVHSLRAAQIGFVLAKLEDYPNPYEVCTMVVFHDIGEARVGDIHKLASRYIEVDEERATKEQLAQLDSIGAEIFHLWQQVEYQDTTAGILAKDADLLDQAVMAKELWERGFTLTQKWIENIAKLLRTNSAQKLLLDLQEVNSCDWFLGIQKK